MMVSGYATQAFNVKGADVVDGIFIEDTYISRSIRETIERGLPSITAIYVRKSTEQHGLSQKED
jgi:hypothetical protein